MTRPIRIHYPGAVYHVIVRGNNKQAIFFDDRDRAKFIQLLVENIVEAGGIIYAYCLMTNHVHLVLGVSDIPLERIMHNITFRYAMRINTKLNRVGHVFQDRYKAILVKDNSYLIQLVQYVHLNPVKAGIVNNAEHYQWSSFRAYIGLEYTQWLETDRVLSQFSHNHERAKQLLLESTASILEHSFVDVSKTELQHDFTKIILITKIIDQLSKHLQTNPRLISDRSRSKQLVKKRAMFTHLCLELQICSLRQCAKILNCSHAVLSRNIRRLSDKDLHIINAILNKLPSRLKLPSGPGPDGSFGSDGKL